MPRAKRPVQTELPLLRGARGGWRPGAGRKQGPNPRVRHRSRAPFPTAHPCLVTLKVRKGIASLRKPAVVRQVEDAFRRGRARAAQHPFRLVHYSIQGNHLHALVEARGPEALGRGMMSLGIRFARAVNRGLGRRGRVLEDRYHVRVLATPRQVRSALRYVLLNARRHAAKLRGGKERLRVPVRLDPASSARWFEGWRAGVARAESPAAFGLRATPAVSRARTWLLRAGWRRHGLLDPSDVPGTA
jgi:REP element-mobilizing transposase RayT